MCVWFRLWFVYFKTSWIVLAHLIMLNSHIRLNPPQKRHTHSHLAMVNTLKQKY